MHISPELIPVFQITVPLLGGLFLAGWVQNRAIDQLSKRLDDILAELRAIRTELTRQGERITRLEERTPPLLHR
jgi:hypothetical protein